MKDLYCRKCHDIQLSPLTRKLWAKSEPVVKSLWHHALDTGFCAAVLAGDVRFRASIQSIAQWLELTPPQAERLAAYLAACHDCYGKAASGFQLKVPELAQPFKDAGMISALDMDAVGDFRHERYGAKRYLAEAGTFSIPRIPARIFASTIELHHQGKGTQCDKPKKAPEEWNRMGNELHAAIIQVFDPPLSELKNQCKDCSATVMALLSLVILSDWLASSAPFSELDETLSDEAYADASLRMAQHVVEMDGLLSPGVFPRVTEYSQLRPAFTNDTLRPVQRAILERADPAAGLTIIEAPMGEGKTEAGAFQAARLCTAWNKQGIYFALPTAATSNQMHTRVNEMLSTLGMGGARLMHGMAWLVGQRVQRPENCDTEDRDVAYDWLHPLRRAMLAESAVGTVDQAMIAAMPVKYSCLRLLGLMGKVLVIDEIHAYDAYMSRIIGRLLEWCRSLHIPVILLSATLTAEKRKSLAAAYGGKIDEINSSYPLITQVTDHETRQIPVNGCARQGHFHFSPLSMWDDAPAIAAYAVDKVRHGGCLCVLMNTVAHAQRVWNEIRRAADADTTVILFHARFKARVRDELEQRCMALFGKDRTRRPEKAILVCTQVVEQSLDVDFDGMITEIAPIDLLLQRAGRIHRHECNKRPIGMKEACIEVLVPERDSFGASELIYAPWLLKQTRQLLPCGVRVPEDVRGVIEQVYAAPTSDQIPEAWARMAFADDMKRAEAGGNMLPPPNPERFFAWDMRTGCFSMDEPEEGMTASTRPDDRSLRVALLSAADIERVLVDPLNADMARLALGNSFTIRAAMPEELNGGMYRGGGLTRRMLLVEEEALPVRIGDMTLDYDEARGALTERVMRK